MKISERGRALLDENPTALNLSLLKQKYSDFREKIEENNKINNSNKLVNISPSLPVSVASPRDILNGAFQQWDNALKQDLLDRMQQLPWQAFERLVVDLLVRMGYGGSFAEAGEALSER